MNLRLHYQEPAPNTLDGWERFSVPVGCGYLGANIFGGIARERIQITENTLANPYEHGEGGLTSFADIYIDFDDEQTDALQYERGLDLDHALAYVRYDKDGRHVEREYFASYPDRSLNGRITADQPFDCRITLDIPYLITDTDDQTDDDSWFKTKNRQDIPKYGTVTAEDNCLVMRGVLESHNVRYAGILRIFTDGTLSLGDTAVITGATEVSFVFCASTNYELRPEVFTEPDPKKKLRDFDPTPLAEEFLAAACRYTYAERRERHIADYAELFGRVSLDLGDTEVPECTTDRLVAQYGENPSRYLEMLYFQYGRYLMISSSRPGTMPANLQGTWNIHESAPWGSGYFHNINVQMNYWPVFSTNIAETFDAYLVYNLAGREKEYTIADEYIRKTVPEHFEDAPRANGWAIGPVATPYHIFDVGGSTGPGSGGLTTKLLWEYYDFTRDKSALRDIVYPSLLGMALYLAKATRDYDGKQLSVISSSPEQTILFLGWDKHYPYHQTVGCAFDQQMIYENAYDLLRCVDILGEETLPAEDRAIISMIRDQIDRYDPVIIGWSGQIKEFREEHWYGEIGEWKHRHISQLVAVHPGRTVGAETPVWRDAAKKTLTLRTDDSTGWALAHRLNAWARCCDGNHAHILLSNLLKSRTHPNLWDTHPPFQIDGNFGACAGIAEMLLQSHEPYIVPLPCLPDVWERGSYTGLCARGGLVFDVSWSAGSADTITVTARNDEVCRIRYDGIAHAAFDRKVTVIDDNRIEIPMKRGDACTITCIPKQTKQTVPQQLSANRSLHLSWSFEEPVKLWRALDSTPIYTLVAEHLTDGCYDDVCPAFADADVLTYKITRDDAPDASAPGAVVTLNHSTAVQRQQYRYWIERITESADIPDYLGE